ncbi:MAG: hypothetical protein F6K19_42460, partial [Cyanothece sp. SIO1E1]|nr:hypothetical protein [Cyanothece sp. SIO1E1]
MPKRRKRVISYLVPIGIGLIILPVPLLRDVHLESALVASTFFCFWGAIQAANPAAKNDAKTILNLLKALTLFFIPLLVHGVIANCLTIDGIGLWVLIPIPSLLFGVAVGRFFRLLKFPFSRAFSVVVLLLVALGVLLFEFFTLPQVYYFNHVWGSWPGPIYDEEVRVTMGLIWFRTTTLLWVFILWLLPSIGSSKRSLVLTSILGVLLILSFFFQPQLGISTPRSAL